MYKLMRKLLILTTLCLALVATPTPNLKAEAAASGPLCNYYKKKAEHSAFYARSVCGDFDNYSAQDCADAIEQKNLDREMAAQLCAVGL